VEGEVAVYDASLREGSIVEVPVLLDDKPVLLLELRQNFAF